MSGVHVQIVKHCVWCCSGMLPGAVLPPSEDHTYHQWLQRSAPLLSPQPSPFKTMTPQKEAASRGLVVPHEDMRKCAFCGMVGDALPDVSRLGSVWTACIKKGPVNKLYVSRDKLYMQMG